VDLQAGALDFFLGTPGAGCAAAAGAPAFTLLLPSAAAVA
jgi:hypothetical protein